MDAFEHQDPTLWNKVQQIKDDVYTGRVNTPEHRAVAWRVAEGNGEENIVTKIKMNVITPTDRFNLAEQFLTEAKETEDELEIDGIQLNPVSDETKKYMIDGLELGISELRNSDDPQMLYNRLISILNIVSRAVEGFDMNREELGSTYLNKQQVKELCENINMNVLFGFSSSMNRGIEEGKEVYIKQREALDAINSIGEKIVLS